MASRPTGALWWLNGPLKDRKVIVWAHNYHVMNYNYIAKSEAAAKKAGPMGQFLKAELGADLCTTSEFCYSTKLLRTWVLVCILALVQGSFRDNNG